MIFDLHNDFPTAFPVSAFGAYAGNANDVTATAAIWTTEMKAAHKSVKALTAALSADNRTKNCPIAIEDIGFAAQDDIYKSFDFSDYFYCSLTWNFNNAFAGGALDDGSLTRAGKEVVGRMCSDGCLVDLSHLNRKSFFDVLDCAEKVICSHTGFNNHRRSIDDEQIRALIGRGAIIGLCTVTAFTDAKNASDFANVIDRFVQTYGDENLAIGSDFNGSTDIPQDISDYDKLKQTIYLLENKGYSEAAINNIFYNNANTIFTSQKRLI